MGFLAITPMESAVILVLLAAVCLLFLFIMTQAQREREAEPKHEEEPKKPCPPTPLGNLLSETLDEEPKAPPSPIIKTRSAVPRRRAGERRGNRRKPQEP